MSLRLLSGALALATALACRAPPPTSTVTASAPSSPVRWIQVAAAGAHGADYPAQVLAEPAARYHASTPLRGQVLRVRVRPGDRVEAKAPLVELALPELLHAAAAFVGAQAKLDVAQRRQAHVAALGKEGLARASEALEADAATAQARAELLAARATLRMVGVGDSAAAALAEGDGTWTLRSPLAGVVTTVDAVPGAQRDVGAGPLVTIQAPGAVQIEARLPPAQTTTDAFELELPGQPPLPLTFKGASPGADPADGQREAWFAPAQPDAALTPGARGVVRAKLAAAWVSVPARAVRDGAVLVRDAEGHGAPTPVTIHRRSGAQLMVEGVAPGTWIAADATPGQE